MRRGVLVVIVVLSVVATACVERRAPVQEQASAPITAVPDTAAGPTPSVPTTTTAPPCPEPWPDTVTPVPPEIRSVIDARVHDPRFAHHDVSISLWIEGWGQVGARNPHRRLLPASNQKLLTAMGAHEVLGTDHRFVTRVVAGRSPEAGVIHGDLVLAGGGDPTLRRRGAHSLAALARKVRDAGVVAVRGGIVVDESRFDDRRDADGWLDWQRPAFVGSLSALIVDANQHRSDTGFLADPASANAELFRRALEVEGVTVAGPVVHGAPPVPAHELARIESEPVASLVHTMLMESDNMIAESLVKEAGAVRGGGPGTTVGGLAAMRDALAARCIPVAGADADGSGLSRANERSAWEWASMLAAARRAPWYDLLRDALPVAGRSGTLVNRLTSVATAGNARAKTGSIIPGRALSGYLTTAGGRSAVFSVVVNGTAPGDAQPAIDAVVEAAASARG